MTRVSSGCEHTDERRSHLSTGPDSGGRGDGALLSPSGIR